MNCSTATANLLSWSRGELPREEVEALRGHLESCASCRAEASANDKLRDAARLLVPPPRLSFVSDVMAAVRSGLPLELGELEPLAGAQRAWVALRERAWTVSISVAVHAAVLLLCAILVFDREQERREREALRVVLVDVQERILLPEPERDDAQTGSGGEAGQGMPLTLNAEGGEEDERRFDAESAPIVADADAIAAHHSPWSGVTVDEPTSRGSAPDESSAVRWDRLPQPRRSRVTAARPGQNEAVFGLRNEASRTTTLARYAPMLGVPEAIDLGLEYLARQQLADGSWDPVAGGGREDMKVAVTALSILPFLAEGIHEQQPGYGVEVVAPAIAWLEARQDSRGGGIGHADGNRPMFNHCLATLALCEHLALLASSPDAGKRQTDAHGQAAWRAVAFLRASQIRPDRSDARMGSDAGRHMSHHGGWGYRPADRVTDTNVSAWGIQSLLAYEVAIEKLGVSGRRTIERSYGAAQSWLQSYTDPLTGYVGYDGFRQYGTSGPRTLTAVGLMTSVSTGAGSRGTLLDAQAQLLLSEPPTFDVSAGGDIDFCRGYFTGMALYLKNPKGEGFRRWFRTGVTDLLELQETDVATLESADELGSWAPLCKWSNYGGRLYSTSMALLVLQTPYRYVAR